MFSLLFSLPNTFFKQDFKHRITNQTQSSAGSFHKDYFFDFFSYFTSNLELIEVHWKGQPFQPSSAKAHHFLEIGILILYSLVSHAQ